MLFWLLAISISAQQPMYKGIISGLTKPQFTKYINSQNELTWAEKKTPLIQTYIKERLYLFIPDYNKDGKLYALLFFSSGRYEWYDYDEVQKNAIELFNVLKVSYGDPVYDSWPAWTEIVDREPTYTCIFTKENISVSIVVTRRDELFYVSLVIIDTNLSDKVIESSEGF